MPLKLHLENAKSHYSSLLITGVAQHRLGGVNGKAQQQRDFHRRVDRCPSS
jgi:hypothetical protein